MDKIRENCKNLKYVKIPTAIKEITEKYSDIIVMDYIDGKKINELKQEDYEGFSKQVVKFGIVTTAIHGLAHGDLHSGNILFIKDENDAKYPYKIGVIDFGIIYEVGNNFKNLLFNLFTKINELSSRELGEMILKSGIIEPKEILEQIPDEHYKNIISFGEEIINETINIKKKANQIQIYKFLSKLNEYLSKKELNNLGIRPSYDLVKSQLVLAMAHGVTLSLCDGDFVSLMDKCINELFCINIFIN